MASKTSKTVVGQFEFPAPWWATDDASSLRFSSSAFTRRSSPQTTRKASAESSSMEESSNRRLFFMHYNFVRIHKALRMSPAMAAGLADTLWSMEDIAERVDVRVNAPKARGAYRKRA